MPNDLSRRLTGTPGIIPAHGALRRETATRPMGESMNRVATLSPGSFDEAAWTVEAIASTFADVNRRDGKGSYLERLDPAALDLSNLDGAPLLNTHKSGDARDVVGVVAGHRMEGGKLIVTLRLSQADDAAPTVQRIREGTIRGLSIGYRVTAWREGLENGQRTKTAARWSISEVSAVAIPADPGATFRGEDMPTQTESTPREQLLQRLQAAHNLTDEWVDRMLAAEDEVSDDEIRTDARDTALTARQQRQPARIRTTSGGGDDPAHARASAEEALFARIGGGEVTDRARPLMGHTLRDFARASVDRMGMSIVGMDQDALFRAAMHTTSDFPNLLTGVGRRVLMASYEAQESPLKRIARQSNLTDFRAKSALKLSGIGALQTLTEAGEIKSTSRAEVAEGWALDTYAAKFSISRKALINDDLGAFGDWARVAGAAAAQTEGNLLWALLSGNPVMQEDSKTLFHADHGNSVNVGSLAGDGIEALDALSAARLALRSMKGLDGVTPINVTPKFLMVGPELETAGEKLLAEITPIDTDSVNAAARGLILLVEPRISGTEWFLFADPASLPVLEYGYLSSAPGPQIASQDGWNTLGTEYRVVLDFGGGAVDWRGAYHSDGEEDEE